MHALKLHCTDVPIAGPWPLDEQDDIRDTVWLAVGEAHQVEAMRVARALELEHTILPLFAEGVGASILIQRPPPALFFYLRPLRGCFDPHGERSPSSAVSEKKYHIERKNEQAETEGARNMATERGIKETVETPRVHFLMLTCVCTQ